MPVLEDLRKSSSLEISYNISFDFLFRSEAPARTCPGGSIIAAIKANGLVAPCQYFPPSPEDDLRKHSFEYME